MKTILFIVAVGLSIVNTTNAQNYTTKNGKISFFSKTTLENIDAVNNQAISVLNAKTGSLAFSVLITGFLFKKSLMQEHFNDEYMESGKYPKATFKGNIADIATINFVKDGSYKISVSGDLTIHGVTNKIKVPGTLTIKDKKINASTVFNILLADYKISIPKLVEGNISKSIELKVDCNYLSK